MPTAVAEITVFISSPMDVSDERQAALKALDRLNRRNRVGSRFALRAMAYEDTVPAVVGENPQAVVNRYMRQAGECGIFVCVLWGRMGTKVIDGETGTEYESGTHYEFMKAYAQYAVSKQQPRILLYRCKRALPYDVDTDQVDKVRSFFDRFRGGDLEGLPKTFTDTREFEQLLIEDLDTVLATDFAGGAAAEPAASPAGPSEQELAAWTRYIATLSRDVDNRLRTSIHGAHLLDLNADESLDATSLPWEYQPKDEQRTYTSIDAVFRDFEGRFLILGGPGSGKTTTMLHIARRLIAEAQKDPDAPLPLLFNLSTFSAFAAKQSRHALPLGDKAAAREEARDAIEEWLASLVSEKYPWMSSFARGWIQNDKVALLLDGLDEVDETEVDALAVALNRYLRNHPDVVTVICTRIAEYDSLKRREETRLNLGGAVTLRELRRQQIDDYLDAAGAGGLRDALANDSALDELAQVPLTLSMMTLAYGGLKTSQIAANLSLTERRRHLFDSYVDRMMQRTARRAAGVPFDLSPANDKATAYDRPYINHHLGWLAVRLSERMQTVFTPSRLFAFISYGNRRSVALAEGAFLAVSALALGVTFAITAEVSLAWVAAGVFIAAIAPFFFEEPSTRIRKYAWTALGMATGTVALGGAFGLLAASISLLLPWSVTPELAALVLLLLTTAVFFAIVFLDDSKPPLVGAEILLAILALAPLLLAFPLVDPSRQRAAWYVAGVLALLQVGLLVGVLIKQSRDWTAAVFMVAASAVALAIAQLAVMAIGAPDGIDALIVSVFGFIVIATESTMPAVLLQITLGAIAGAAVYGVPGATIGMVAAALASIKLRAPFLERVGHVFLEQVVRLRLYAEGALPWNPHPLLRYCVDTLLLKDVGRDCEFVHRVLRDHFATRELTPRLSQGTTPEQLLAIERLSRQGEAAIEPLVSLLKASTPATRAAAVAALARIPSPATEPHLRAALGDPSVDVRRSLAESVARVDTTLAVALLTEASRDRDATVREAAVRSSATLSPYSRGSILFEALDAGGPDSDRAILRDWPDESYVGEALSRAPVRLLQYFEDADPRVRRSAVSLSIRLIRDAPLELIRKVLFDRDPGVRLAILDALLWRGAEPFAGELKQLWSDPLSGTTSSWYWRAPRARMQTVQKMRASLVRLIARIPDRSFAPLVEEALGDDSAEVRRAAASSAGRRGQFAAAPILRRLLRDKSETVRTTAAEALGLLGDAEAFPDLIAALGDQALAPEAAEALAAIGNPAAIPAIRAAAAERRNNRERSDYRHVTLLASLVALGDRDVMDELLELRESQAAKESPSMAHAIAKALAQLNENRPPPSPEP